MPSTVDRPITITSCHNLAEFSRIEKKGSRVPEVKGGNVIWMGNSRKKEKYRGVQGNKKRN